MKTEITDEKIKQEMENSLFMKKWKGEFIQFGKKMEEMASEANGLIEINIMGKLVSGILYNGTDLFFHICAVGDNEISQKDALLEMVNDAYSRMVEGKKQYAKKNREQK